MKLCQSICLFLFIHSAISFAHIDRRGNCLYIQHRETRPLLGQRNLYKNSYTVFAYDEFVSYIERNEVNPFAYSFSWIKLLHFP